MQAVLAVRATVEETAERFLLVLFRYLKDWDKADLSREIGVVASRISVFDRGLKPIPRHVLEKAAEKVDFPAHLLDFTLGELRRFIVVARRGRPRFEQALAHSAAGECASLLQDVTDLVLAPLATRQAAPVRPPVPEDRLEAERLWERLRRWPPAERRVVVEEVPEFQTWALCERVAAESIALAPNQPKDALGLAELALEIARRVPGGAAWRRRLEGLCWAKISNARRVLEDLHGAEDALSRAASLWESGAPGDPGLLNRAWLPWIEGNLRRAQRHFPLAVKKIEEALILDGGELRGKILVSKSSLLKLLGEPEASTPVLEEAASLIDGNREPRLALVVLFNLLEDLAELGRAEDAASRLAEVRGLAERLGGALDLTKVVWLEGKVAAGRGRLAEAQAAFEQARRELDAGEQHYLYALVSLNLALLLLEQGRTSEVRTIAGEMLSIFKSKGIHREALAALRLFCDAAEQEAATVELTRRVERFLRRAQLDPGLTFEAEGAKAG